VRAQVERTHYAEPRAVWRGTCKSVEETNITATRTRLASAAAGGTPLGRWKTGRRGSPPRLVSVQRVVEPLHEPHNADHEECGREAGEKDVLR
jgi:hypothetical protein